MISKRERTGSPTGQGALLLSFVVVILLLQVPKVDCTSYYISEGGNDNSTGLSSVDAFASLRKFLEVFADGDEAVVVKGSVLSGPDNRGFKIVGRMLTLRSEDGDASTATIDLEQQDWLAMIVKCTVTLDGVTIINGRRDAVLGQQCHQLEACFIPGGGAVLFDHSTFVVKHCVFRENSAYTNERVLGHVGGAIAGVGSTVTVTHTLFEDNVSDYGGAIAVSVDIVLTIDHCIFRNNVGRQLAGAINCFLADLFLTNSVFEGNTAPESSMLYLAKANVEMNNVTILNQPTVTDMGATMDMSGMNMVVMKDITLRNVSSPPMRIDECVNLHMDGVVMEDNLLLSAMLEVTATKILMENCVIRNNKVSDLVVLPASGIILYTDDALIERCTFEGNRGGANVLLRYAPGDESKDEHGLVVKDSLFLNNYAKKEAVTAGVVCSSSVATITIEGCVFEGNFAENAAALYCSGGCHMHVSNSEFKDNESQIHATVEAGPAADLDFKDNSFEGNVGHSSGGAIDVHRSADVSGVHTNSYHNNRASIGGAVFFGGVTSLRDLTCRDCKGNKASLYGDDFATQPHHIGFVSKKDQPKEFDNLENMDVDVGLYDYYDNVVIGHQRVAVSVHMFPLDHGLMLNAPPVLTNDKGEATVKFSPVGKHGKDYSFTFSNSEYGNVTFKSRPIECASNEVAVDFPPDSDGEFSVCEERNTEDGGTTLLVLHIIGGILLGLIAVMALMSLMLTFYLNRRSDMEGSRFHLDYTVSVLVVFGLLLGCAGGFLFIPDPSDSICPALPWMWAMCAVFVMTPLVVRLGWFDFYPKDRVTPWTLTGGVTAFIFILNAIVLMVWTIAWPLEEGYVTDDADVTYQCEGDHAIVFISILLGINGVVALVGLVISMMGGMTKKRVTKYMRFKENLSFVIMNSIFVSLVAIAILFVKYDDTTVRFAAPVFAFVLGAFVLIVGIFILPASYRRSASDFASSTSGGSSKQNQSTGTTTMNTMSSNTMSSDTF